MQGGGAARTTLLLRLLARPGFSTAEAVSGVSGRGVGVDVAVTRVRALGGTIEVRSEPGRGTIFVIRVPLTLAIVDVETNRYPEMVEFLESMDDMDRVYFDEGFSASLEDVIERAITVLS